MVNYPDDIALLDIISIIIIVIIILTLQKIDIDPSRYRDWKISSIKNMLFSVSMLIYHNRVYVSDTMYLYVFFITQ